MGQKWIIDVLADLHAFADQNGLPLLAHQLDVTACVAQAEIASVFEGAPRAANENERNLAPAFGDTGTSHRT